jgi:5-oxoprolinase (ATP-hydrolysing) subunit A
MDTNEMNEVNGTKSIDLNCDMGERPEAIEDGSQEAIMPYLTSVNIACGGHAGDAGSMSATVAQAKRWGLGIGAHPSYPDRPNFGRVAMAMSAEAIADSVFAQVTALAEIAACEGVTVGHVKPHGALYNSAAEDAVIARAIADGVSRWRRDVVLVGLAGSQMLEVFREAGFAVAREIFADRRYEADGTLRPRKYADALITDPAAAAEQVFRMHAKADTVCVHGDTAGALAIAAEVSGLLKLHGVALRALAVK